jgi:DNA-binding transcriptional ArsR family regulator
VAAAFDLDGTFAALADPTRRGVVDLLRQRPRRAGDLAAEFGMSRPAMSRHLRVLRTHGLVQEEADAHDARARIYRLLPEPMDELQTWVSEVQRFWDDQLDSFQALANKRRRDPKRRAKTNKRR